MSRQMQIEAPHFPARLQVLLGEPVQWSRRGIRHGLIVLTESPEGPTDFPGKSLLLSIMKRSGTKPEKLRSAALAAPLDGVLLSWVWVNPADARFRIQSALCQALKGLMVERPAHLALSLHGAGAREVAAQALYVAWVNGAALPDRRKNPPSGVSVLHLHGAPLNDGRFHVAGEVARANTLARHLTLLPPNELTPGTYRQYMKVLAQRQAWRYREYTMARLRQMGAGAFMAVAQGSPVEDAAIVHLQYRGPKARRHAALVGKGICFDTGGHNLKPARYMYGMHEDMNGSAVALGILSAASALRLPVVLDVWLALAQNHISPLAYRQNDVVTALDGTTIEIVHTDAEGRMVLADTLTLASRQQPDLILDFATLTGSMHTALGSRQSGIFASDERLERLAKGVGQATGERVVPFPLAEDYDVALESKVADVKQCTPDGDADHILAARFLQRFTGQCPWVHMDLSASRHEGGLGAVGSDVTGFGVHWGVGFLDSWLKNGLQ